MMTALALIAVILLAAAAAGLVTALFAERRHTAELARALAAARRQNIEHEDAMRELRHLDSIKDEFISTVSHELRTPLTSIRGALGLLSAGLMGSMDDKATNLLRIASNNTDRLVRLINDILDLERMDSGRAPMQLRAVSLAEIIEHSADTMSAMAHEAGVRIETLPPPAGMPSAFEGDPDRIQQVLVNLLSNAIKFSPSGNTVLVCSSFDDENLFVRVEDAGRGVPAEKLESIFGRFNQVESSDSRQKGGTGLGLAICRTILAQHHGAIWAERNDQDGSHRSGTTFVIRLPRSPEAEAEASGGDGPLLARAS